MTMVSEVRYARSGDVNIAYRIAGDGPFDVVFIPGTTSHVELSWDVPFLRALFERIGSFARLIVFDKRGTGMSDAAPADSPLEVRMDDVRAVMDAAGSQRAVVFGVSEGAPMSILFAATYPERTWALVLQGGAARALWAHEDPWVPVEAGRFLARQIPGATYVELPGRMHIPALADAGPYLDELQRFLESAWSAAGDQEREPDRVLATVMFTDIVGSSERAATLGDRGWRDVLQQHHELVRRQLMRYRGAEVDTAGDGFFASFDGPARAIRCATLIVESMPDLGLQVRAGLHTGECELVDGKVAGIAVHTGVRVASQADPGEVLVSSTVKDLVAGSGIQFEDRGVAELKGIPGEWRLFAVERSQDD